MILWYLLNKYTKRALPESQIDMSFSKSFSLKDTKVSLGMDIYNIFDNRSPLAVWPLTGDPNDPGEYYTKEVALTSDGGSLSGSFYDMPWRYSSPREINFFVRFDFK